MSRPVFAFNGSAVDPRERDLVQCFRLCDDKMRKGLLHVAQLYVRASDNRREQHATRRAMRRAATAGNIGKPVITIDRDDREGA